MSITDFLNIPSRKITFNSTFKLFIISKTRIYGIILQQKLRNFEIVSCINQKLCLPYEEWKKKTLLWLSKKLE